MAINLSGPIGFIIFGIVLVIFELFTGTVAYIIARYLSLTGFIFWIFVAGFVLIMNLIFIEVN